jgi:hypothetical protein
VSQKTYDALLAKALREDCSFGEIIDRLVGQDEARERQVLADAFQGAPEGHGAQR